MSSRWYQIACMGSTLGRYTPAFGATVTGTQFERSHGLYLLGLTHEGLPCGKNIWL